MSAAIDPRVVRGLRAQLERRRRAIAAGDEPVGWKVGLNAPAVVELLGIDGPVAGFLTAGSVADSSAPHSLAGGTRVACEAEVAIHLGADVRADAGAEEAEAAIAGLGPALEVVDFDRPLADVEDVVAANVFHRAVAFGVPVPGAGLAGVGARVLVNGEERGAAAALEASGPPGETVARMARVLAAGGERLRAGDRIIAGALFAPVEPAPGDVVELELGSLGRLGLAFAP